jgi:hypothetical protein
MVLRSDSAWYVVLVDEEWRYLPLPKFMVAANAINGRYRRFVHQPLPARAGSICTSYSKNLEWRTMAKLVYGMNQSLDGYIDHLEFRPSPALFRHFIEQVRGLTGSVYGRRM